MGDQNNKGGFFMDSRRASEIASSPVMANVTFNGTQVYIESVNGGRGTANIHLINQPNSSMEVPLGNLMEH
jgi:small acid-soluble spore protein H (minor)